MGVGWVVSCLGFVCEFVIGWVYVLDFVVFWVSGEIEDWIQVGFNGGGYVIDSVLSFGQWCFRLGSG